MRYGLGVHPLAIIIEKQYVRGGVQFVLRTDGVLGAAVRLPQPALPQTLEGRHLQKHIQQSFHPHLLKIQLLLCVMAGVFYADLSKQ